jgi:hypothetical protein
MLAKNLKITGIAQPLEYFEKTLCYMNDKHKTCRQRFENKFSTINCLKKLKN